MRPSTRDTTLALLAIGLCTEPAAATPQFPRAGSGDGYLAVPVGTVRRPQRTAGRRRASSSAVEVALQNEDFFYAIELGIGTPPQSVTVLVDTGSSELWVNPDCSTAPSDTQAQQCESFGQYNPRKSRTPPFGPFSQEKINYGDPSDESTQTSVDIKYFGDVVSFGKAQIKNQTFGVVTASEGQSQGIMGLAPDLRGGFAGTAPYSLVLNTMAEQGVIASRVFTLDLRHVGSDAGAVIYGGLDRNKFVGSLEARPFIRGAQGEFRLAVQLDSLGFTQHGSQSFKVQSDDANVILDSGTTLTRMHSAAAVPILDALDAQDDGEGYFYVPCSLRNSAGSVDFGFGGKTIKVPFSDFVLGGDGSSSGDFCYIGLTLTTDQQILGDSVLRAGYFVFDWDNEQVHIAQAANCGDSDIVAVGSGKRAVPDVQGSCKAGDLKGTSAPLSTKSSADMPTAAFTTVFTVTTCPPFDHQCQTGVVATQTIRPAETTGAGGGSGTESASGSASGTGSGGGGEDAGVRPEALGLLFTALGVFATLSNVL